MGSRADDVLILDQKTRRFAGGSRVNPVDLRGRHVVSRGSLELLCSTPGNPVKETSPPVASTSGEALECRELLDALGSLDMGGSPRPIDHAAYQRADRYQIHKLFALMQINAPAH